MNYHLGSILNFPSNITFVKNSGNELSIYEKCHHNIIHATFDLPIPLPYYYVWDYKHANAKSIKKNISAFE